MKKIKFGVVGLGNIGTRHMHVINGLCESTILAGVCDIENEKNIKYSELYGVPSYLNLTELLKNKDIQIVSVCTPHGLHAEMSIEISKAGKNVLVEKPMALSTYDCNRMIKAAEDNNVKLFVVKQNRYNVPIALTKDIIFSGKLGKIYNFQCNVFWNRNAEYYTGSNWRGKLKLEGGALYTQVSHFIDLLVWWFGDVNDVHTLLTRKFQPIEFEDSGSAILNFESGVTGTLNWNTITYNKNLEGSITIIAEKGVIKIGGQYLNKIEYWDVLNCPMPDTSGFIDTPNDYGRYKGTSSNHDKVINDITKLLLGQRLNVVEGDEGIKTIEVIEKIYNNATRFYD